MHSFLAVAALRDDAANTWWTTRGAPRWPSGRADGFRSRWTNVWSVLCSPNVDVLMLDQALTRLAEFDPRKSRIAELRFFGGLSLEEMAHVLDISVATAEARLAGRARMALCGLEGRATATPQIGVGRSRRSSIPRWRGT